MLNALRSWLKLEDAPEAEPAPLRELVDALERIDPDRARHLARFAYLLGRVANADEEITPAETAAMESLVQAHGRISANQAVLVVALAKSSHRLFGGTADFMVAQEFAQTATYNEKVALVRCLFDVAASNEHISMDEETELHRITNQLHIEGPDLISIRLEHRQFLPGLSSRDGSKA
jgi:uncharacterized tellurite resistance protein B-like protein